MNKPASKRSKTTDREFTVILEGLRSDISVIAEGQRTLADKVEILADGQRTLTKKVDMMFLAMGRHEEKIFAINRDIGEIKVLLKGHDNRIASLEAVTK